MFRTFLFMLSFAALGLMSIIVPAQAAQSVKALSPTMQSKVKAFKRNAPPAAIRNLAPTTKESATGSGIRRVDIHYTAEGATSEPLIQVPESLLRPVGQVGSAHSDLNIVGSIHMGGLSYMTVDPELDAAVNKIIGNAPTGCVVLDPMHK